MFSVVDNVITVFTFQTKILNTNQLMIIILIQGHLYVKLHECSVCHDI